MRLIHLIIYKVEPLANDFRIGPLIIDKDSRWEAIPTDRIWTAVETSGYFVIMFILIEIL